MSFLLGCEKVSVEMPTKRVLSNVSLGVNTRDRIGIVGANGDGKSTLLKVLAAELEPDEGRIIKTGGTSVGYLKQTDELSDTTTVKQVVIGDRPEYDWAKDQRIRDLLEGLLFGIQLDDEIGHLSGGQRRRVDLARVLAGDWNVLMLDEPTNHLDIRTITWLAEHLKQRWPKGEGALLVVSHDRWFLDEVCQSMWEVYNGQINQFEGGFSAYIMQRVERDREAAVAKQKHENQLRRELAWLSRGARARATKPKFHVAAARALIADVPELRNQPELKRMAMARIGKDVVDIQDASVSYGSNTVLEHVDWMLGPGDRVGIVGENGIGKTTLLKLLQGEIEPTKGKVKIGATVRFAMLSQRLENLAAIEDERVRTAIGRYSFRRMADGKEVTPSKLLDDLGFDTADLNEFVRDLSGGQRRKLALMLILMEESNVLVLDEPGNDLDIDMLAALETVLDGWPGTLVVVTHDRNLMERVTDDQYAVIDKKLRHVPGGIDEYLSIMAQRKDEAARAHEKQSQKNAAQEKGETPTSLPHGEGDKDASRAPETSLSQNEQRRLKKLMASNEKKSATLRGKIEKAREAMAEADPSDFEALLACQTELQDLQARLDALEEEWLEAATALGL